jgi:CubicO group peptidase (beta-lactamase class C family)
MKSPLFCFALLFTCFLQGQSLENHIRAVENSLIPYVEAEGFKPWNIIERMKYHKVSGASIAVIKDFKVDWVKAYGWADTIRKIPMSTETMLSAGSISKLLMAAAALRMVQDGKLALDQPINNYLSSWKLKDNDFTKKTPVTLRMLLSHTGGTSQSAYWGFPADQKELPSIVDILAGKHNAGSRGVGVIKQPGTGFQYSGGGSMIAQMALMDQSKQAFEPLMRQMVFDKLGMANASFEQPLSPRYAAKASWGYSSATWYTGTPYVYPQQAAAGLYTTAGDLAKFLIDLQLSYHGKGQILSQAMLKEMMKAQATVSEGEFKEEIALGPFLLQRKDNKSDSGIYFMFDGVNAGFTAFSIGNLSEGYGVVVLLNSGDDFNALGKEIIRAVAKTYNWHAFLPEAIKLGQVDEQTLNSYVGRYRQDKDVVVSIRREGPYLVEQFNGGKDIICYPIGKDSIVFSDFKVKGFFKRNEKGDVIGMQSIYAKEPWLRMQADEMSFSELLSTRRMDEAKKMLREMNLDESQITYMAYEKANDLPAAKAILEVALEKFPQSAIVLTRWGDYYGLLNDKVKALEFYEKAFAKAPHDAYLKDKLKELK